MSDKEIQIYEIVNRETRAWDTKDVQLLMTIFHPDMVWPWPKTPDSHDPINWTIEWGRFNYKRWSENWQQLFDTHDLVHNKRSIKKIELSDEEDGAFAVVDIDTLWRNKENKEEQNWKGRVCKVYTKLEKEWKLIMHTGVLNY
ncbi:hypothetical protein NEF87_001235 [Candidatus Lokiarchaeum ossiferum]|uniref:SnoaL-like domain-containing protein n=1 Tax=Candidatus Lokiarchaeum ossiferum TaxID=2951803 RepID=A0ABY6HN70_9ARCH|nr:hypothetical protein NEF87_001235 [Candidatus Lokiarchaeum sp. B-35]